MVLDELASAYAALKLKAGCGSAAVRRQFRKLVMQCNPALDPSDARRPARLEALLKTYELLLERETARELGADAPPVDAFWRSARTSARLPRVARASSRKALAGSEPPARRTSIRVVSPGERPPLVLPVDVTFEEAALGTTLDFEVHDRVVSVAVPAGADHGTLFSLQVPGADGAKVTVYIELRVAVHPIYRRAGSTLYVNAAVSEERARAGGILRVPIPGEVVEVRVEPYSKHGDGIRVAGKGMHSPQGRGDLIVVLAESSRALR